MWWQPGRSLGDLAIPFLLSIVKRAGFIGIDLTSSPSKPTACVALGDELHLDWFGFCCGDGCIVEAVEYHHPRLVAIDSPLSLPKGLCCLEESCPCQPLSSEKGRMCERELSRRGISCYYTTKRSIIKDMVYRAISLKEEMTVRGYRVIEVYPYATKVQLFGRHLPRKTTPAGIDFLRERIGGLMPHLVPHLQAFSHDLCDALLAAYTAYLHGAAKAENIGDPVEGVIVIPASLVCGKFAEFH